MEATEALRNLVAKLDEIGDNSQFKSMFTLAWAHGAEYKGPNWGKELEDAKTVLAAGAAAGAAEVA